jgi:hypothetical protein
MRKSSGQNPRQPFVRSGRDTMDTIQVLNARYRRAFKALTKENPLVRMTDGDREHLIACLVIFEHSLSGTHISRFTKEVERAHDVAEDARSLAKQIGKYVFQGPVADARSAILNEFRELPDLLTRFADQVSSFVGVLGGRGQKHKAAPNDFLVEASEVVKMSTGSYNDRHLMELLQRMSPEFKDFSEDAIRKRRNRTPQARYEAIRRRVRSG